MSDEIAVAFPKRDATSLLVVVVVVAGDCCWNWFEPNPEDVDVDGGFTDEFDAGFVDPKDRVAPNPEEEDNEGGGALDDDDDDDASNPKPKRFMPIPRRSKSAVPVPFEPTVFPAEVVCALNANRLLIEELPFPTVLWPIPSKGFALRYAWRSSSARLASSSSRASRSCSSRARFSASSKLMFAFAAFLAPRPFFVGRRIEEEPPLPPLEVVVVVIGVG